LLLAFLGAWRNLRDSTFLRNCEHHLYNVTVQYSTVNNRFKNAISFGDNWKRALEVRNHQRTWLLRVNSCLLSIYLPFRVAKTGFTAGQTSLEFYEGKTNKNSISRVLMYVAMRERWRWCWPRRQVEGNGKAFLRKLFESYILSAFSKKMCISWHIVDRKIILIYLYH